MTHPRAMAHGTGLMAGLDHVARIPQTKGSAREIIAPSHRQPGGHRAEPAGGPPVGATVASPAAQQNTVL